MNEDNKICKNAEEAADKFIELLNEYSGVVLIFDRDGNYVDASEKNSELLYRPAKELIGKNVSDIFPEELSDLCKRTISLSLEETRCVSTEYVLEIGSNQIWFEGVSIPFTKNYVLWLARDITGRKQEEEVLLSAVESINGLYSTECDEDKD